MSGKVWFITGASRGFGRIWAEAALKRGDKVAATARIHADVADLSETYGDAVLPMALDVTNAKAVQNAVSAAYAHFGRLDVVLNNAGYALVGAIEEAHEADVRAEFDTNFFGALRVIQAALPLLRRQGSGHIIGVSSVAGIVAGPITGFYNASKFALEALHESLAQEIKGFGVKVTLLEPGAYATGFASMASLRISPAINAYSNTRAEVFAAGAKAEFGDPEATADAILRSSTRRSRRCGSLSARKACRAPALHTPIVSPPGKHGKPFPPLPRARPGNTTSHRRGPSFLQ